MAQATTGGRPNIVFVLADNVGWGDFSCYGGGIPTPRIDKLASEGIRFNNYTIESQCTPTRTAIITGRQSVRCGTYTVIPGQGKIGLTPWEYGIAKLLSDAGYATSCWGKWHLGDTEGRLPTDQGFDEWWGYRNSVDEAGYGSYAAFREAAKARGVELPKLWEGRKGEKPVATGDLDLKVRPLLDEMIVEKANDYIKRAAKGGKPFFAYVALSHVHPPEKAHPTSTRPIRRGWECMPTSSRKWTIGSARSSIAWIRPESPRIRSSCFQATTRRFACPPPVSAVRTDPGAATSSPRRPRGACGCQPWFVGQAKCPRAW